MAYSTLKAEIAGYVRQNGEGLITGDGLKTQLFNLINSLGAGYQCMGIATPDAHPGSPDGKVFYFAADVGTYVNFNNLSFAPNEAGILCWNGTSWLKYSITNRTIDNVTNGNTIVRCTTAEGTAQKEISISYFTLRPGLSLKIVMNYANSADNATLKINSLAAKPLIYNGKRASSINTWKPSTTLLVSYDNITDAFFAFALQETCYGGYINFPNGNAPDILKINAELKELYFEGLLPSDKITVTRYNSNVNGAMYIVFQKNGSNYATVNTSAGEIVADVPYRMTTVDGTAGYAVFACQQTFDLSVTYSILDKVKQIGATRIIADYVLKHINETYIQPLTSNKSVNKRILEIYIPGASTRYGSSTFYVSSLYFGTVSGHKRFEIKIRSGASGNPICCYVSYIDITQPFYDGHAICPIKDWSTDEIVGYGRFIYPGTDYSVDSNPGYQLKLSLIENFTTGSLIEKMLNTKQQLVLIGDSSFGFNLNNVNTNTLVDYLMFQTGIQSLNCGFGGCQMAWRTQDGSNNYDKFTWPNIVDALVSQDFSAMEAANVSIGNKLFSTQISSLKKVDFQKKVTIALKFMANDFTGNSPIGEDWSVGDELASLNKSTFIGAFAYGCKKLLEAYPLVNILVFLNSYGIRNGQLPQDAKNELNLSVVDYSDALKANCYNMGLQSESLYMSFSNAFNQGVIKFDGSHLNNDGLYMFARYIKGLMFKNYVLNGLK